MNEEELKQRIQYTTRIVGDVHTMKGTLQISDAVSCVTTSFPGGNPPPTLLRHMHDQIEHNILRALYDDYRREFNLACDELLSAQPYDAVALMNARERVMKAAMRLQPTLQISE